MARRPRASFWCFWQADLVTRLGDLVIQLSDMSVDLVNRRAYELDRVTPGRVGGRLTRSDEILAGVGVDRLSGRRRRCWLLYILSVRPSSSRSS